MSGLRPAGGGQALVREIALSTTADLFGDLNALLITSTNVDRHRQRGAQYRARSARRGATERGAGLFVDALKQLAAAVEKMRGPLLQADAVVAGFEILADSLSDLGDGRVLSELTQLPDAPFQPVIAGIGKSGAYLKAGLGLSDALPAPNDLFATSGRLKKLGAFARRTESHAGAAPGVSSPSSTVKVRSQLAMTEPTHLPA